ncbi:MAG: hypothetical protein AABN34_04550 [Acidobacteriota bacterium]
MINRIACCIALCVICLAGFACSNATKETPQPIAAPPASQPAAPAAAPAPLAPSAYRVEWVSNLIPSEMAASQNQKVSVTLKNAGDGTWPAKGTGGGPVNQVLISYHWLPAQGDKAVLWDGVRSALPHDIGPGETFTQNVTVIAPKDPGSYRLQLTLVHEGVTWFEVKGASGLTVPVTVR